jgi:hypothetical protein
MGDRNRCAHSIPPYSKGSLVVYPSSTVAVYARCVIPIDGYGCAREIHQQGRGHSLAKPHGEHAKDVGPHPCSCVHNNHSASVADEPQRVRMNKFRALWQDVLPRFVRSKAPQRKHSQHVHVREWLSRAQILSSLMVSIASPPLWCHGSAWWHARTGGASAQLKHTHDRKNGYW